MSLSPTTLLHETYLSLSSGRPAAFPDRARFLAYASRAMRGLLVDYLRRGQAQKRGGLFEITSLPTELPEAAVLEEVEGIGEALDRLGDLEPRLAQIVDLKFFCGFSFDEIAGLLGLSARTAQRDWDKARILLQRDPRQRLGWERGQGRSWQSSDSNLWRQLSPYLRMRFWSWARRPVSHGLPDLDKECSRKSPASCARCSTCLLPFENPVFSSDRSYPPTIW